MSFHVFSSHPKRENMYSAKWLPLSECSISQRVNFFDDRIRHGIAANGNTTAGVILSLNKPVS